MNKQETIIVVLLFGVLLAWFQFVQKPQYQEQTAARQAAQLSGNSTNEIVAPALDSTAATSTVLSAANKPQPDTQPQPPTEPTAQRAPESRLQLSNDVMTVQVSSWGAALPSATLLRYPASPEKDSPPLTLNFSAMPALAAAGIPGLTTNDDFVLSLAPDGRSIYAERTTPQGLSFKRTLAIRTDYTLDVTDSFSNTCNTPVSVPDHSLLLGPMRDYDKDTSGMQTLGADVLVPGPDPEVVFWGGKILSAFGGGGFGGCSSKPLKDAPQHANLTVGSTATWVCVKSKFFAQILEPSEPATNVTILAARDITDPKQAALDHVAALAALQGFTIQPGQQLLKTCTYYVGPKEYSHLRQAGPHWAEVMEFGSLRVFRWICEGLLWMLITLHGFIPNYGIAIMALTFIVRMVFWPITHKSTESMKKMQKLQPEMQRIREKYKDNPQKMNQEVMALYQIHKVNPLAGCLPLLVQIPVFIGLFTVLRSAVELRYAGFLWISDLSAPERILQFSAALPLLGWDALNILPFIMTATTVWQTKLTPTTGDPQQQTMMMAMSVMMLFFLYNMPSALCLYWTFSQCLSIAQLYWQRRTPPAKKKSA